MHIPEETINFKLNGTNKWESIMFHPCLARCTERFSHAAEIIQKEQMLLVSHGYSKWEEVAVNLYQLWIQDKAKTCIIKENCN